ncbi:uncharacterized protein N7498_008971 [Penicillium cinerascens]|uniref:Uncharacterized protein n=1 Tax=Penicillium cinerascens TaxID=70096 RepID=A0A9W9MB62_9EURO|nr:uncharacterized protein N7498_008971 [Penicillium cinerascens]KAJ5195533.1 hypothetical protein N7498_008971 [Penicillium cinerascens]
MQWLSAVIVMGITSYFVHNWPKGEHTIYQEVIVCQLDIPKSLFKRPATLTWFQSTVSVAFFLPAFVSPFMPNLFTRFVTPIDIIFSYLWLTASIFAA